VLLLAETS